MKKGIAEEVAAKDLSAAKLTEKLRLLLSDPKYKNNVVAASKVFRDQKDTPLERGLWWIEWALRNPNAVHFKSSASDLNFFEIQSIDVIAFSTVAVVTIVFVIVAMLRKLLKRVFGRRSTVDSKRKHE